MIRNLTDNVPITHFYLWTLTRWADDFVVVCRTRQEAQAARVLAELFLRDELGVSLHPEKTRIVHVDQGFEFLGYKVKRG